MTTNNPTMIFFTDDELKEIFGLDEYDSAEEIYKKKWETPENMRKYKEVMSKPLSEEERKQIMEDITKAREDVNTLSELILKEVWGM